MKILILGANGMIGHKMYQVLSATYPDTWALLRQPLEAVAHREIFDPGKVVDRIDLADFTSVTDILEQLQPAVIINAAGITIRRGVNDDVCRSILVNSALPHFLKNWVNAGRNRRLVHFSTDCVFSGKLGAYTEESVLDATDMYGRTKGMGEVDGPNCLTLRGSMIGRELDYRTELLEWFLAQPAGSTIRGFSNVLYSGITTVRMAAFVKKIISGLPEFSGIYNVSSEPISKYALLCLFNNVFRRDVRIEEDKNFSSRKDLLSQRFYTATGFAMPSWSELAEELQIDAANNSQYYIN